jgi:hypothetical protein
MVENECKSSMKTLLKHLEETETHTDEFYKSVISLSEADVKAEVISLLEHVVTAFYATHFPSQLVERENSEDKRSSY